MHNIYFADEIRVAIDAPDSRVGKPGSQRELNVVEFSMKEVRNMSNTGDRSGQCREKGVAGV